jgi:ubiquinone biosynthesis protein Coq4
MADYFRQDENGASALRDRPRLGRLDLAEMRKLPEGSLGREFAEHMIENGLSVDALPSMQSPDELSYVRAHLYETHDVWHVVTGFGADVADELGLQAFYLAQLPARLAVVILTAGLFHTLFYAWEERDPRMQAIARGWLLGHKAKKLFGVRWAELWTTPLSDVRRMLHVDLELADRAAPSLRVLQEAA